MLFDKHLKSDPMNCELIAVLETFLHSNNLTEHLFLVSLLDLPEHEKIASLHPNNFNMAPTDGPCLHMR